MNTIKTIMLLFIVCLLFHPVTPGYADDACPECASCGKTIYIGEPGTDTLTIAGIDLARYAYVQVQYSALVNEQTLFVSGRASSDAIVLTAIALDTQKVTVIAQYPIIGIFPIEEVKFTVFVMPQLEPPNVYVIATYTKNESGMRVDYISTQIEVFRLEPDNQYTLVNKEEVEEINIGLEENTDPQFIYKHLAAIYSSQEEEAGTIKPATKNTTTIFPGDANQDGYPDILVERQIYLSRKIGDTIEEDFLFDHEELHVMYFNSEKRVFSPLTLLRTNTKNTKP